MYSGGFGQSIYLVTNNGKQNFLPQGTHFIHNYVCSYYLPCLPPWQVSSCLGVIWFIGVYLFVFSYWLNIPGWIGPLVMFILIFLLFAFPLPTIYHRSRVWLAKEIVSTATSCTCTAALVGHNCVQ